MVASDITIAMILAVFFCLTIEMPIMSLESFLRNKLLKRITKIEENQKICDEKMKPNGLKNPAFTTIERL